MQAGKISIRLSNMCHSNTKINSTVSKRQWFSVLYKCDGQYVHKVSVCW